MAPGAWSASTHRATARRYEVASVGRTGLHAERAEEIASAADHVCEQGLDVPLRARGRRMALLGTDPTSHRGRVGGRRVNNATGSSIATLALSFSES